MALGLASILLSSRALAEEPKYQLDIESTDPAAAIDKFSQQTDINTLYATDALRNRPATNAIHGMYTAREALDVMLAGTGLVISRLEADNSLVSIVVSSPAETYEASSHPDVSRPSLWTEKDLSRDRSLQEVIVTGSNLAANVDDLTAPLVVMDQARIERAPYLTVQDTLRTLPIVSRAGPSETFNSSARNFGRGASINLRGLGPEATLVLVDGERQPFSGYDGDFVDVANIPASAVERIDVLPDGASAIYGSDAIAGVVNIILRHDVKGAETSLRYGDGSGGSNETVFSQLWGHQTRRTKALVDYEFSRTDSLPAAERSFAANSDKRPLGGSDYSGIWSSPGNIVDPLTQRPTYGITSSGLVAGRVNESNRFSQTELLPYRTAHKIYVSGSHALNDNWETFETLRFTHRAVSQSTIPADQYLYVPATNPYFPPALSDSSVIVAYRFANDLGPMIVDATTNNGALTAGFKGRIGHTWRAAGKISSAIERLSGRTQGEPDPEKLDTALSDPSPVTAFDPFSDGTRTSPETLRRIQLADRFGVTSRLDSIGLSTNGDIGSSPFGTAHLALGAEVRREGIARDTVADRGFDRRVSSLFAEVSVPLWSGRSGREPLRHIELSAAARIDRYSDAGETTNPRLGLRWIISKNVGWRASWGTSFRAPTLLDTHDTAHNDTVLAVLPDPRAINGSSLILAHEGNNPALRYETAENWSAGLDLFSANESELSGSITFWNVRYENRILRPGPPIVSDILRYESDWSQVIERDPSRVQVEAACQSPDLKVLSCYRFR